MSHDRIFPISSVKVGNIRRSVYKAGHRSLVGGSTSQVVDHRSQVTVHSSQVAGRRSQVAGRRSQVAGRRLQVTNLVNRLPIISSYFRVQLAGKTKHVYCSKPVSLRRG